MDSKELKAWLLKEAEDEAKAATEKAASEAEVAAATEAVAVEDTAPAAEEAAAVASFGPVDIRSTMNSGQAQQVGIPGCTRHPLT